MSAARGIEAAFSGRLGAFTLDAAFDAPLSGITALFGPSGSGKTSVLRCVAGLTRLGGCLRVGDQVWQDDASGVFLPPHRRRVGYVFQEASLFAHLDVRRNLLYGARRARGDVTRLDFDQVVELLGVGALLDRAPQALSGGERQRVAIGRALLSQPRLLLMDEPLHALDRAAREELLPYLRRLHETLGLPVLYVSHDVAEVAQLADRIVVLAEGRATAAGAVASILERLDLQPATGRFEAGVVLTARVTGQDERFRLTRLDHHGQAFSIPLVDAAPGEQVRLRIRARDVALARERPQGISIRNILSGTVAEIVEEADTAYAETLVDIGGGRLRARVTREAIADLDLAVGTPVFALVKSISFDRRAIAGQPAAQHGGQELPL